MKVKNRGLLPLLPFLILGAILSLAASQPQQTGKKRRIEILNADLYTYDSKVIASAERLIGNVKFSHNNVIMYCDSAYSYRDSNMVDAFGNVHIVQGDTLNLYGDKINYTGDNKIAKVFGNVKLVDKSITLTTDELIYDLRENVGNYQTGGKIVDTANVLTSKIGRYYSNENLFFFKDNVTVTNKDFILKADTLKYNSQTERVFIVGPTTIVGTTKAGTLYSERGWYDTRTNIAELYNGSKIMNKDQYLQGDTIFYSRNTGTGKARHHVTLSDSSNQIKITGKYGVYNETTKIAFVTDSAIFMQFSPKDTLFMHADTLKSIPDTDKELVKKTSTSRKPIVKPKTTAASADKTEKKSNQIPLVPKDSTALITKILQVVKDSSGIAKLAKTILPDSLIQSKDSLLISKAVKKELLSSIKPIKDLLTTVFDSLKSDTTLRKITMGIRDSLAITSDSSKVKPLTTGKEKKDDKLFMAYNRVRIFKKDLQGECDSLVYQIKDSVMRLFKDPVLWSDTHQMSAEKIEYKPHEPDPDMAYLDNDAFIISKEDSIKFNQISGKNITGHIYFNALRFIEVNGNARTLYYLKSENRYSGMNSLESSKIKMRLFNSKIDSITFFPNPEGKTLPLKDLNKDNSQLQGFIWRESERPVNRYDLLPLDEKRKKNAGSELKPAKKKVK